MCWCDECSEKHPMCNDCFVKYIKSGVIKKTPGNRKHITKSNLRKMI